MNVDRNRMLQDADEFRRLVGEILAEFPEMDRNTAERVVIHSGHKNIEQICLDMSDLLLAYIEARGENSAQFKGLLDRIRNIRNVRK